MSSSERDEQGRFVPQHSDEEILTAVRMHEPAGTSEVAADLGIKRPSADYRLRRLKDEGKVTSKKIGATLAWQITEEGEP